MLTVLFDGIASGMLLFMLAVGLSVTMGLMNFINLAHGAFAMLGGYVCVILLGRYGVPFPLGVLAAFAAAALAGAILERTLYCRLYGASHLDQVLFSIGLVFMATSVADFFMGAQQQMIALPAYLTGIIRLPGLDIGIYRLVIIVLCLCGAIGLQWMVAGTRFGSRLRASVSNARVARGLGIDVDRVFLLTFALGSGLAGAAGALGIEVLGLDPNFPVKFMVYFLIVVAVGGTSSISGPFFASLLLGVFDVAGKYYVPELGAFIIYVIMLVVLAYRPEGLFSATGRTPRRARKETGVAGRA